MSLPSTHSKPSTTHWASVASYCASPFAASLSVVPVFHGFRIKTIKQMGNPNSNICFKESIKGGIKAAPTIGITVGTQMAVQNKIESILASQNLGRDKKPAGFTSTLISSTIVGTISAPALAVFNGQTMNRTALQSIKALSRWQVGAIIVRETSFVFFLRYNDRMAKEMKIRLGDNKKVEYGAAFMSGVCGSLIGHPADTALTLWQKDIKIKKLTYLGRGASVKAITLGFFNAHYKFLKDVLDTQIALASKDK